MLSLLVCALLLSPFFGVLAASVSEEQSEAPGIRSLFKSPLNIDKRSPGQLIKSCTVPGTVALTFDDGPYYYIYDLVKMLDAAGAKATFFFNGKNNFCIYDEDNVKRVRFAYNRGHQVASHTWAHMNLTSATISNDKVHDEMWKLDLALTRITGADPAFMRPPYGAYNQTVLNISKDRGQAVVLWDLDSEDTSKTPSVQNSINIYNKKIKENPLPNGRILTLNHETKRKSSSRIHASFFFDDMFQVMPAVLQSLKKAGYRMVTVAECLGKRPYRSVKAPEARTDKWKC
ncbi:hypothetical protein CVT24_002383 [Panaeolus cyanescens]|uniref:NodB homology domain-containing protein n=1 Tax=Panaeolus cyanescens TaxID=181874 RepID=A0A409WJZ3_9AGAR|nr:hypothetical protein CVT24_002383 [Panaeolus cyanescens]